jgi:hypothetical protein
MGDIGGNRLAEFLAGANGGVRHGPAHELIAQDAAPTAILQ